MRWLSICLALVLPLGLLLDAGSLAAQNGVWTQPASGNSWSVTGNWLGGIVASGTDSTADFSTLDLATDNTVHLNGSFTIGNLVFGDTNPSNNWTLDNNGTAGNVLTLSATATPTIGVVNDTATISAVLAGSGGFTLFGAGTLTLSGANTFSGATTVSGGTLNVGGTSRISASSPLVLGSGSVNFAAGQALGGLTVGTPNYGGGGSLAVAGGTLALGAITPTTVANGSVSPIAGTVDFAPSGTGKITTSSTNTAMTILGGWATFGGGATWAIVNGDTSIGGLAAGAYSPNTGNVMPASGDVDMSVSGATTLSAPATVNSLRFSAGDAPTTINGGQALDVSSGGILVTSTVGANAVTISDAVSTDGGQLTVHQYNTAAPLTITSFAANGAFALVKSGPGMLILGPATQTYSGGTFVNQGTLELVQQSVINSTILPVMQPVTVNAGAMLLSTYTNEFGQGTKAHSDPNLGAPSVINLNGGTLNVVSNKDNGIPAITFSNGGLVTSQGAGRRRDQFLPPRYRDGEPQLG